MNKWSIAGASLLCIAGGASAQAPSTSQVNPPGDTMSHSDMNAPSSKSDSVSQDDREFLRNAATGGIAQVEAAKLAQDQGTSPSVKSFGQEMVTDHSEVDSTLSQLAQSKGVTIPETPNARQRKAIDQLKTKQGAAFDKAYANWQVKGHEAAVSAYKKAEKSKDPDIAAFAKQTLPKLEQHLEDAKAMKKQVAS